MMHFSGRLCCLVLSCVLLLSVFSGCGAQEAEPETEETPSPTPVQTASCVEKDTLTVGETDLTGAFGPFYWETEGDEDAAELTQGRLVETDRAGEPVLLGVTGETRQYDGESYDYTGLADCTKAANADGTVTWTIQLRQGVNFSDGTELTAEDVLFTMYVLCDPAYDGPEVFGELPIAGLDEYQANMALCWPLILSDLRAGADGTASAQYTPEQASAFLSAWNEAGEAYCDSISAYVTENYGSYATAYLGCTAEEFASESGLQTALGMLMWGLGEVTGEVLTTEDGGSWNLAAGKYPASADFWNVLFGKYGYDPDGLDREKAEHSFSELLEDAMLQSCPDVAGCVRLGESADTVTGICQTGKYTLTVTLTGECEDFPAALGFFIGAKHAYGKATKGDLSAVKTAGLCQTGLGAYTVESYEDGILRLEANSGFWRGEPSIPGVTLRTMEETALVPALLSGSIDIAVPELSRQETEEITQANGGTLSGDVISASTVAREGYGCIGIRADRVCVGNDPGSIQSKYLRCALATALSAYRTQSVEDYYGALASVIQYPISPLSPYAPQPGEAGYQTAYSEDVYGHGIVTDGMTEAEQYEALRTAVRNYLFSAGYAGEDSEGRLTVAPEGAKRTYTLWLCGKGEGEHPVFQCAQKAQALLASVGITLEIRDVETASQLWTALENGEADLWAAARTDAEDSAEGFYAKYASDGAENDLGIADSAMDRLLLQAQSAEGTEKAAILREVLELVLEWGCEVPVYESSTAVLWRTGLLKADEMESGLTAYWGWTRTVWEMELQSR